jgi:alkanesulfonate monooxygenase SsuD/methylene tetrahydromethanopterin reductase-like flavin-dependent oxidoreductase (luciferase family)
MIAKQVLSLDALAGGGRAVLGIGLGAREDDYEISGMDLSTRGAWLDRALDQIRAIWNGDGELEAKVGPRPIGDGPTMLVGGYVETSIKRAARVGDGWTQGGAGPDALSDDKKKLDEAWKEQGREGKPKTMALTYFSLGPWRGGERAERPWQLLRLAGGRGRPGNRGQRRHGHRHGEGLRRGFREIRLRRAHLLPLFVQPRPGRTARRSRRPLARNPVSHPDCSVSRRLRAGMAA